MTGEGGLHQAKLLRDWTDDLILFSNGFAITPADRQELAAGGVEVVDGVVTGVEQNGGKVSAIVTTSGGRTAREILYTVSSAKLSSDLASQLGCRMIDGPPHPYIAVDELQQTSVAGVFAAGDITRGMYSSVFAAADGVRAAVACHRSLIMPGGVVAKAAA
jgi:thioredoxin reductase